MKHIITIETFKPLTNLELGNLKESLEDALGLITTFGFVLAMQSNQPDDDILVIPNATKSGEPRYTSI
jgi:hypothetical protein